MGWLYLVVFFSKCISFIKLLGGGGASVRFLVEQTDDTKL